MTVAKLDLNQEQMELARTQASGPTRRERLWNIFRRSPPAVVGLLLVALIVGVAIAAPWVAPYGPNEQHLADALTAPAWEEGGSLEYILGTDHLGRDILSRIIHGARASLLVALIAGTISALIGSVLGLMAGYYGRVIDTVIMTLVDIQLAFPLILLALAMVAALGVSFRNLIIVMGLTSWMSYARIVRASVLSLKEREFVLSAHAVGASDARVMFRHILPNIMTPVIVLFTLELPRLILVESGLSFLGLGAPQNIPTWGRMLADGRSYLSVAYWIVTYPGLALMATVLGINLFGDGLRDALDPRLRID